jgi:hypothetical protein
VRALALAALLALGALAADRAAVAPFSAMPLGPLKAPWRAVELSNIKPLRFDVVVEDGTTVLRVRAEAAAGSAALAVDADPRSFLDWRWKVDRVVGLADMTRKSGDDFAARVYVFFDLPLEELSFTQRVRISIARAIYGRDVPTAAICYVWDNRHPVGTTMPNPYTDRVRMIVAQSGSLQVGNWLAERRDLEQDYRRAFGLPAEKAVPRVSGLAVGADTDQTGESVTAWFGDLRLYPRP